MAKVHDTKQVDTLLKLIATLVGFVAVAAVALAAIYMIVLNVLPLRLALPIFAIDAVLAVLPLYLVLKGKGGVKKGLCIVLSALIATLNFFVISYSDLTYNFLQDQYTAGSIGNVEYSVVAQATSKIDLTQKGGRAFLAGIQANDVCKKEAETEMQDIAPSEFSEYDSVSELIDATETGDIDLAVVQTSFLGAYEEYFPDLFTELIVLTTFKTGAGVESSPEDAIAVDITKPFAIYISGADDYGDIDQTARSDVNMLVLVDPEHYRIMLVNTPRDYYVQLHDTTGLPDKLTHAGTYGIEMSEATMEDLYDINIDYHVHINYDTLITLIDSVGGIVVDNPVAFNIWGAQFDAGEIYMDGPHALLFARARKELSDGDNSRGENQQRIMEALIAHFSASNVAVHYTEILGGLSGTFRSNIPPSVIAQLFKRQISLGGHWTIEKSAVTGTPSWQPTYSMGSDRPLSVVLPDQNSVAEVSAQMQIFLRGEDPQAQMPADSGAAPDPAVE